jgi:hypothetical protein
METILRFSVIAMISLFCSCALVVNGPPDNENHDTNKKFTRATASCFPIENNTNAWYYTEAGGNTVEILVTDTISDDGVLYYRVSFRERQVDTTDDWFKRSASGTYFAQSLTGPYNLFLPSKIDSMQGSFISSTTTADYTYYDSLVINGTVFRRVLDIEYSPPLLHGFDEIVFADSVGIVRLKDDHGRWPISYEIDSCSVFGAMKRF